MADNRRWVRIFEFGGEFGRTWVFTTTVLGVLLYPLAVAAWYNNFGTLNGDWIHHLFLRKEVALSIAGGLPRILTVGGSGCLFSLDAEALQRELSQPVINLCSHAGVGLEYMLARARRHARQGDTVILVPEYRVLTYPDPRQTRIEWEYFTSWDRRHYLEHGVLEGYRSLYALPFSELWKSRIGWQLIRGNYPYQLHQIYDVTLMSPNGDLHESLGKRNLSGDLATQFLPPSPLAMDLIDSFGLWARNHGVRVLATYQAAPLDSSDLWRTKALFADLPGWWKDRGIETVGTPEAAVWPSAGFMDTLQHAGPGVSYANAVQLGRVIRGKRSAGVRLLIPPHPAQTLLPLAFLPNAEVEVYFATTDQDRAIREFQKNGGRLFAATVGLGKLLISRGFRVRERINESVSPAEVWESHRSSVVAACARPDSPAVSGMGSIPGKLAWVGIWRDGKWWEQSGTETAELKMDFSAPLVSGAPIEYHFSLRSARSACAMEFQRRDREPDNAAVVRMLTLDPARGIVRGIYNFDSGLRTEAQWVGEIVLP